MNNSLSYALIDCIVNEKLLEGEKKKSLNFLYRFFLLAFTVLLYPNTVQEGKIAGRAVLIAGQPGTGKTATAMGIIHN